MTRRTAISALAGLFAGRADARFRNYSSCLPEYLTALVGEAYTARKAALAALTTAEAVRTRQKWVRETFWKLAGGEPERTPLNTRATGAFERPGYRVENIIYESRPGFHIPANLYLPTTGKPPYPGVLFQMGHSLNGKAYESYQKCCQGLARLGYMVLAFDPMGQGERTYYPKLDGTITRLGSADEEHSLPGRQMLLAGDTATRLQTWDAVRSLDVLAAHPQVDPKRLASTGQSGGGTLTMMLAAVDDRLSCAAVSSGNTENFLTANFRPPGSTDDAEQNFIDGAVHGFDRWDTLYPLAPKPLLVMVSDRDFFGTYSPDYLLNGREEFETLSRAYATLGHANRIEWASTALPHSLAYQMRMYIYNFFERHLRGSDRQIEREPEVKPEEERRLWAGPTGNVVRDFGSKTPAGMARERLSQLRPGPIRAEALAKLLRVATPSHPSSFTVLGRDESAAVHVETLEVQSVPRVFLPAYLFIPRQQDPKQPLLLLLEPRGRNARWREGDLYQTLAARGASVCAFDVRGIGDLSPEVGRGNPFYTRPHAEEEAWTWASLMVGRPLLGQRVNDILATAAAMREHPVGKGRRCILAAAGRMAVPALCAAVLDPAIDLVYLAGATPSWASLVRADEYADAFANFLPGVLAQTDLPFLRESLGARLREGTAWDLNALSALWNA